MNRQDEIIREAISDARKVQEFIWQDLSLTKNKFDMNSWVKVFSKRIDKIAEIDMTNMSAIVELRKRVLQQAALSIAALEVIDRDIKILKNE